MESSLGVRVVSKGANDCNEKDLKKCKHQGCWIRTEVGSGFSLIDANTSSIVGPSLTLTSSCGCRPPTQKSGQPVSLPAAHALMEEKYDHACAHNTCLNGGRCLPTRGGHK